MKNKDNIFAKNIAKKIMGVWLVINILLSVGYVIFSWKGMGIVLFICWLAFLIVGISVLIKGRGNRLHQRLSSINENFTKALKTIEKVKSASNEIVDGVSVVRELAEENKESASAVVNSMGNLVEQSSTLSQKMDSSMEMTEDIDKQVANVFAEK